MLVLYAGGRKCFVLPPTSFRPKAFCKTLGAVAGVDILSRKVKFSAFHKFADCLARFGGRLHLDKWELLSADRAEALILFAILRVK